MNRGCLELGQKVCSQCIISWFERCDFSTWVFERDDSRGVHPKCIPIQFEQNCVLVCSSNENLTGLNFQMFSKDLWGFYVRGIQRGYLAIQTIVYKSDYIRAKKAIFNSFFFKVSLSLIHITQVSHRYWVKP